MIKRTNKNILKFIGHPPYCDGSRYLDKINKYTDEEIEKLLPEWWYTNNIYKNVDVNSKEDKVLYIYNQIVQDIYKNLINRN